jgi:hypothetical protein
VPQLARAKRVRLRVWGEAPLRCSHQQINIHLIDMHSLAPSIARRDKYPVIVEQRALRLDHVHSILVRCGEVSSAVADIKMDLSSESGQSHGHGPLRSACEAIAC